MSISSKFKQLGRVLADPRWWPFYLQRRFIGPTFRHGMAEVMARRCRPAMALSRQPDGIHGQIDVQAGVLALKTEGILHFGQLLSRAQTAELHGYFLSKPVHDPYRQDLGRFLPDGPERHPDSHIAHHDPADILRAPHLLALANRPDILDVVGRFLGCKPTLAYLATWWSYHTELGPQQAENFHRDVDDWRFLKLFIYLTDVGPDNGPHVYVVRSSASGQLRQIRRFDDQEIVAAFGQSSIQYLQAPAGTAFLEDTFGFHKGQPVDKGRRLIFQAVYSMFPLPYGPKVPVAPLSEFVLPDGSRPDPWINRAYLEHS